MTEEQLLLLNGPRLQRLPILLLHVPMPQLLHPLLCQLEAHP